jgi:hypothetical protein
MYIFKQPGIGGEVGMHQVLGLKRILTRIICDAYVGWVFFVYDSSNMSWVLVGFR